MVPPSQATVKIRPKYTSNGTHIQERVFYSGWIKSTSLCLQIRLTKYGPK